MQETPAGEIGFIAVNIELFDLLLILFLLISISGVSPILLIMPQLSSLEIEVIASSNFIKVTKMPPQLPMSRREGS